MKNGIELSQYDDYISNLNKLKENIYEILEKLSDKSSVIIIDGINHLPNGLDMINWLPKHLPKNLKIILSVKGDQKTFELLNSKANITVATLKPFENDEYKKNFINKYFEQYLKALDDEDIDYICKMEGSNNPLLLKILLNELRYHGQYETLKEQIANFPPNPKDAFKIVLNRMEQEETYINIDSKEITRLIFGLMSCARYGLSEGELLNCIKEYFKNNSEDELKEAIRLAILQVKPFMKRTDGRIDFYYDSFKLGANEKYKEYEKEFKQKLAKHLEESLDFNELAIKTHGYYNDLRREQGLAIEYPSFDDLPEDLKLSNISQAKSIPKKLKLIACEIAPIDDIRETIKMFTVKEIESLAELTHEEWVNERDALGWIKGPVKNVENKLSPYLVPWNELSEDIKDYDRDPIINIPKILNLVDMKVVRSDIDIFNEDLLKNELAKLKNMNNQIYEKNNNYEKAIKDDEDKTTENHSFENGLTKGEKKDKKKKGFFSRFFNRLFRK